MKPLSRNECLKHNFVEITVLVTPYSFMQRQQLHLLHQEDLIKSPLKGKIWLYFLLFFFSMREDVEIKETYFFHLLSLTDLTECDGYN